MPDALAEARTSERQFRSFFDSAAVALWVSDLRPVQVMLDDLRATGETDIRGYLRRHPEFVIAARRSVIIKDVNESGLRLLKVGSKTAFFTRLSEFLPEADESFAECIIAIDEKRPTFEAQAWLQSACGELIPILVAINLPPVQDLANNIGVYTDLRERTRYQRELARAHGELDRALRVASMGQLTASIAHEVNQPLSAVINYAKAARRWLDREVPDVDEARSLVESVVTAAQHAGDVVRRVRKLLGTGDPDLVPLEFDAMVVDAVRHAESAQAPTGAKASLDLQARGAQVLGDRVLLQQVVINLFTNAVHAMEDLPADRRQVSLRSRLEGGLVRLDVEDRGPGFPSEVLARGLRPFQTTKPQGTGLGLTICRSTIEAHGGRMTLADAPQGGALVSLSLPAKTIA